MFLKNMQYITGILLDRVRNFAFKKKFSCLKLNSSGKKWNRFIVC